MLELLFAIKDADDEVATSCGLAISVYHLQKFGTPLYLCQWLGLDVDGTGTSLEDAQQLAAQEPMAPKVLLTIYRGEAESSLPAPMGLPQSEPALHATMCGTGRDWRSPRGTAGTSDAEVEGRLLEMLESLRVSNKVIGRMQRSIYDLQLHPPPSRGSQVVDELAATKVELGRALQSHKHVSDQLQELESQNASSQQELVSLGASVKHLEEELSIKIAALHEMQLERDNLQLDLVSHQDASQEAEGENNELRESLHQMQAHVAELDNQRAEQELAVAGCDEALRDLAREQARAAELDTALNQLRSQSASKDQEQAAQQGQLQIERDRAADLEQAAQRLESQVATLEQQRLSMQEALQELELERSRAAELETAAAELREQVRSCERDAATNADLHRQLDDRFAREAELESAMSRLTAQLAAREKDKEQALAQLEAKEAALRELQAESTSRQATLAAREETLRSVESQHSLVLDAKEQALRRLETESDARLHELEHKLREERQQAIELQAELDGKDQAMEALAASLRELEADRDARAEELEERAAELEGRDAVLAEWKADWSAKAEELNKTSAALQEVQAEQGCRIKEQRLDRSPTFGGGIANSQLEFELQTAQQALALAEEKRGVEAQRALALDEESRQLREALAGARAEAEQSVELKGELASCRQVHAEFAGRARECEQVAAEAETRAEERRRKDDALERQMTALQRDLDRCKLGADDAKEEAATLRLQLQASSSQNDLLQQRLEDEAARLAVSSPVREVPKARLAGVPASPRVAPRYQRLSHATILNWHRQKEETRCEILEPTMENPI